MERSTIHLLHKRGKCQRAVAQELGRSRATVARALREPVDARRRGGSGRAELARPPMRKVARRPGETTTYLRRHLPDLCQAISERHLGAQVAQDQRSREQPRDEVRRSTYRVQTQGRYPSASRIAPLPSRPGAIRSEPARTARREALRELGWRT